MHIRDPTYQFSSEAKRDLAHLYALKNEKRRKLGGAYGHVAKSKDAAGEKGRVQVLSNGDSQIFVGDSAEQELKSQELRDANPGRQTQSYLTLCLSRIKIIFSLPNSCKDTSL
jgi:hypothetical protein